MNPACALCRGACCESIALPIPTDPDVDTVRWLSYRGTIRNQMLRIEARCSQLTPDGQCGQWASRPKPCQDYPVGSDACRYAITERRSTNAGEILATLEEWLRHPSSGG